LRNAVEQSPRYAAVRHAQALALSGTTVWRILHQALNFHFLKYSYGTLKLQQLLCLLQNRNNFFVKSSYALLLVKPQGFTGGPCKNQVKFSFNFDNPRPEQTGAKTYDKPLLAGCSTTTSNKRNTVVQKTELETANSSEESSMLNTQPITTVHSDSFHMLLHYKHL
jgi:hypothetical protein